MCEWIEKEVKSITESDITTPPEFNGEFATRVEGAFVSLHWRKVYTRVQQLRGERQAMLGILGIGIVGAAAPVSFVQLLPGEIGERLASLTWRIVGLENALCDSLMAEHTLWSHVCLLFGSSWEVFYRSVDQEREYMYYLAAQTQGVQGQESGMEGGGLFVNKPLDQNLN